MSIYNDTLVNEDNNDIIKIIHINNEEKLYKYFDKIFVLYQKKYNILPYSRRLNKSDILMNLIDCVENGLLIISSDNSVITGYFSLIKANKMFFQDEDIKSKIKNLISCEFNKCWYINSYFMEDRLIDNLVVKIETPIIVKIYDNISIEYFKLCNFRKTNICEKIRVIVNSIVVEHTVSYMILDE